MLSWSVITSVSVLLDWVPAPVTKTRTKTSPHKQEAEVWEAYQCGPEDTLAPSSDNMTNTEAALVNKGTTSAHKMSAFKSHLLCSRRPAHTQYINEINFTFNWFKEKMSRPESEPEVLQMITPLNVAHMSMRLMWLTLA